MEVLRALSPEDWSIKTIAGNWTVKDVTTHLLDGSLRVISLYRDDWEQQPGKITDYRTLVDYLNQLNAEWVLATRRLSPALLMEWLEASNEPYVRCLEQLDLLAPSRYSVAWAGEPVSTNAFHIAREYTERWHHQQQIREAVGMQGILSRQFYGVVLQTFLQGLPHAFRDAAARPGTRVVIRITGEAGGEWSLEMLDAGWILKETAVSDAEATFTIQADFAWKVFTKAISPEHARAQVKIEGQETLALHALKMVSVMA